MATDEWITFSEATEIIRARLDYSIGRAEAVVQQTKTSGEIRSLRSLMAFDGIIDPHNPPEAGAVRYSRDDLVDWIGRQVPTAPPSRYPGDAELIREGLRLIAGGMNLRATARKLAPRAEGTSLDSKTDRLRKALARARPGT
jgi:hypothetical protein